METSFFDRGRVSPKPFAAPVAQQESSEEEREETDFLGHRFLSMDERLTGGQHDSWPMASRVRQIHPIAAKTDAYLS